MLVSLYNYYVIIKKFFIIDFHYYYLIYENRVFFSVTFIFVKYK